VKVLILGVNGFIGSHLVDHIIQDTDWEVYGLDLGTNKVTWPTRASTSWRGT